MPSSTQIHKQKQYVLGTLDAILHVFMFIQRCCKSRRKTHFRQTTSWRRRHVSIWIFHNCLFFPYFPDTTKDVEAPKRIKRKTDRLTAYACEDSTLNITCGQDLYLDVIRANYGRFSITICNDHGNTDWKVDCQAGRTLRAMQARCSNQHDCIVPVQSSIFGDPCPGTFKYIEVHYACRKGTYKF